MSEKQRKTFFGKTNRGSSGFLSRQNGFSFDLLRYYIFKESVIFSSLLYSSSFRISNDERRFLEHESPVLKGLMDVSSSSSDVDSILRAGSLSSFIKTQQFVANSILNSDGKILELDNIPFPPYIPKKFLTALDKAVKESCVFTNDNTSKIIIHGHGVFIQSITMLKNIVYPKLFAYITSAKIEHQEEKRQRAINAYYGFLSFINGQSELFYFCKWMGLEPFIERLKEKHIKPVFSIPNNTNELSEKESLTKFTRFIETRGDIYFVMEPPSSSRLSKTEALYIPVSFSGLFSYSNTNILSVSPSDILLHFAPLIENAEEKLQIGGEITADKEGWNTITTILEMQHLFLYKQKVALHKKELETGESLGVFGLMNLLDEKTLTFRKKDIPDILKEQITSNIETITLQNTIIDLIDFQIGSFSKEFISSANDKFNILCKKEYFINQTEKTQLLSILNMIRLAFYEHRELLPKIKNEFYVKIRDDMLNKVLISVVREITMSYQNKKENNVISSVARTTKASAHIDASMANTKQTTKEEEVANNEYDTNNEYDIDISDEEVQNVDFSSNSKLSVKKEDFFCGK